MHVKVLKRLVLLLGAACFGMGLIFIFTSDQPQAIRHWFGIVPIGDPFPAIAIASTDGELTSTDQVLFGKWTLLCFAGSPTLVQAAYPAILSERYGADVIQFISILPKDASDLAGSFIPTGMSFWFDAKGALEQRLQIPEGVRQTATWTFLINPSRRVEFSVPHLLKTEDLRLLIESRLSGTRSPTAAEYATPDLAGISLPHISLRRWQDSNTVDLPVNGAFTLIFFPASSCVSCAANQVQNQVDRLRKILSLAPNKSQPVLVVLSKHIPLQESQPYFDPIKELVYQATEDIPQFEDPYFSLAGVGNEAFVLTVTTDGLVEKKVALEDWLQPLTTTE